MANCAGEHPGNKRVIEASIHLHTWSLGHRQENNLANCYEQKTTVQRKIIVDIVYIQRWFDLVGTQKHLEVELSGLVRVVELSCLVQAVVLPGLTRAVELPGLVRAVELPGLVRAVELLDLVLAVELLDLVLAVELLGLSAC